MGVTPGHVSRQCRTGKFKCQRIGSNYVLPESTVKRLRYLEFNPDELAHTYRKKQQFAVQRHYRVNPNILGILAPGANDTASLVYAKMLKQTCDFIGFRLGLVEFALDKVQQMIEKANEDPAIQGIFVFYPIFKDERDAQIRDMIVPHKDIEGLSRFWSDKLYANERFLDDAKKKKAILPCTSLGILKTLAYVDNLDELSGQTFEGKTITIFNRSDVVGRPLAYMLKNDGATVYSFDITGGLAMKSGSTETPVSRDEALATSDIVVTGVPSRAFEKVRGEELKENTTCLNFSFVQNFEDSAKRKSGIYVPRVGPMTIAMCIRNALRLYDNNRDIYESQSSTVDWNSYGNLISLRNAA